MEREAPTEKEGRVVRSGSLGLELLDGESMHGGGVVGRKCEAILERERERGMGASSILFHLVST